MTTAEMTAAKHVRQYRQTLERAAKTLAAIAVQYRMPAECVGRLNCMAINFALVLDATKTVTKTGGK